MSQASKQLMPAPVVALTSWLVPGLGYVLSGERTRGLTVGITILAMFTAGLIIGGQRVIELPPSPNWAGVMEKPWFVPQVLAGPITFISAHIGKGEGFFASHARASEIGTLYTAIAGMLNLLAIIDATDRARRGKQS